ncbi:MAG: 1-(5-phosphoribosyl)-5-((5-phosphoribosylamino)methylideneamino)imidazole-4-carboxamide isomerase [Ruminococcaceae bacterium]|nr:1-(5-phosphoribosyl)-5-((5-phosphoribosylamino)methylideneamino)imidazole-4-carboxamide isomerase [Oscillospiraceae bacterium]
MIILPAIDLLGGRCVRLVKGEYNTADKVAEDALQTALYFKSCGAEQIHMVDLDGAKDGATSALNRRAVSEIIDKSGLIVELGGGLRSMRDLDEAAACGVQRLILGSAATDLSFLSRAIDKYGDRITVGIDAKNGYIATAGWINSTDLYYIDFAKSVVSAGASGIIFTDISRDGTLTGPNLDMLAELSAAVPQCKITASGGIHILDDIKALSDMELWGAICGKSIYAGTLDLKTAIDYAANGGA